MPRKRSKDSAATSFSSSRFRRSAGSGLPSAAEAILLRTQYFSEGLEMWRYSVPILPQ